MEKQVNRPVIVHIVGKKGAGKTDLMAGLIRILSAKGYRVAAVRHSPHAHAADRAGTDTDRYKKAGAVGTALAAAQETSLFVPVSDWPKKVSLLENVFCDAELVLMEGGNRKGKHKIEVKKAGESLLCKTGAGLLAVVGPEAHRGDVPVFAAGDVNGVADLIEGAFLVPGISAAVMAGGRSRRLGRNKALLEINNRALLERVLNRVSPFVQKAMVITNHPEEYCHLDVATAKDIRPGCGPLSGIHAALTLAVSEYVLVMSCDIPLVTDTQIRQLVSYCRGYDITIFKHKNFEPLCAVYRQSCLDALDELIDHQEYRIIDLFPTLNVNVIRVNDADVFRSINTREDYEYILTRLIK